MKEGDEEEASIFRRSLQQRNTKRAISVQRGGGRTQWTPMARKLRADDSSFASRFLLNSYRQRETKSRRAQDDVRPSVGERQLHSHYLSFLLAS